MEHYPIPTEHNEDYSDFMSCYGKCILALRALGVRDKDMPIVSPDMLWKLIDDAVERLKVDGDYVTERIHVGQDIYLRDLFGNQIEMEYAIVADVLVGIFPKEFLIVTWIPRVMR